MATQPTPRTQPARVLPDDQDRISRVRRRLAAVLDRDLTDTGTLEWYLKGLEEWADKVEAAELSADKVGSP